MTGLPNAGFLQVSGRRQAGRRAQENATVGILFRDRVRGGIASVVGDPCEASTTPGSAIPERSGRAARSLGLGKGVLR